MKVLVCGGRDYSNRAHLYEVLDKVNYSGDVQICHGAARGADTLAGDWAADRGVISHEFPADWNKHGRAAGPIRNKQMLDEFKPNVVIAFPGGAGTQNMIRLARKAGVIVHIQDN